jgi:5-methylcytosine-specific restriction endonuclease McrA
VTHVNKAKQKREYLRLRQQNKCYWCGREMLDPELQHGHSATIEHIVPRSAGGRSSFDNLVAACRQCNNRRGSRPAEDFMSNPSGCGHEVALH